MKDKMSDAEEKKWIERLNKQGSSFLYRLNKSASVKKENSDEKPW
jgi:hypothetical protein